MTYSAVFWTCSFLVLVTFLALVYFLSPVLLPFLLAFLIAYLMNPIANKLTAFHVHRTLSIVFLYFLIFLILGALIFFLLPLLERQVAFLINKIPVFIGFIQQIIIPFAKKHLGVDTSLDLALIKKTLTNNWKEAGGFVKTVLYTATQSGRAVVIFTMNFLITLVVSFYIVRDWNKVLMSVKSLFPRNFSDKWCKIIKECDLVVSAFFRGQLMVMLALGVVYSVGLSFVGLDIALLIGMGAGLLAVVPYLGFIVGIASAILAAMLQFGSVTSVVGVLAVFIVGQLLESLLFTPLFVGDKIGLHPVAVIFSVLAGGELFGFVGVLLALPSAAVILVVLRHLQLHLIEKK
jgi:predicted PurR-regulated permease PerM